jgi:hypothetical protein
MSGLQNRILQSGPAQVVVELECGLAVALGRLSVDIMAAWAAPLAPPTLVVTPPLPLSSTPVSLLSGLLGCQTAFGSLVKVQMCSG